MKKSTTDSVLAYQQEIADAIKEAQETPVGELEQAVIDAPAEGLEALSETTSMPSYEITLPEQESTEYHTYEVDYEAPATETTAQSASYTFTAQENNVLSYIMDENADAQVKNLIGIGTANHHIDEQQKAAIAQFKFLNPQTGFLLYRLGSILKH